jgi:hypothetical protein
MAAVEYFRDRAGEWRFRIVAGNGEIVASSEGYTRQADARRGLADLSRAIREIEGGR